MSNDIWKISFLIQSPAGPLPSATDRQKCPSYLQQTTQSFLDPYLCFPTQRQPNRPAALDRFYIVGDKAGFVAIRRPRINGRHSENTGAEASLPSVVFHVALAQELRPFQSSLPAVVRWAGLRNGLCIRI